MVSRVTNGRAASWIQTISGVAASDSIPLRTDSCRVSPPATTRTWHSRQSSPTSAACISRTKPGGATTTASVMSEMLVNRASVRLTIGTPAS
jgi:hypothetical protein